MPQTLNGNMGIATLDFGMPGSDMAIVAVPDPQVRLISQVALTLTGPTADHDIEDSLLEQIHLAYDLTVGVGFTIYGHAPYGTWGRYNVQYTCTHF